MAAALTTYNITSPQADRVASILRRQGQMEAQRSNFENFWRQVAERVLPRQSVFLRAGANSLVQGEQRTELIFDATAGLALERFAAAMEWMLVPRTQRWHTLAAHDIALQADKEVAVYLDAVTEILFAARYSPRANFASQAHEAFMSLGAFGTGAVYIDDSLGDALRYRVCHLSEIFFAENHVGAIDTIHRKFNMTARQVVQKWGNAVPEAVILRSRNAPDSEMEVIHAIQPREEVDSSRGDMRSMPWASCYILREGNVLVDEGGYRTMPYAVSRYVVAPRETYGRSPAMTCLPDIKMLNEMAKTDLRASQKIVDPPLLMPEDGILGAFDLRSGALNYGGVDEQGRVLVHPLNTGARVDIAETKMEQRRKAINDTFLVTLFQILVQTPEMTATEALLRAQEKGALLAPTMGRQQSEMLGPLIERELDILARAGQLPPMPPQLAARRGAIRIEYSSPLNQMQKADQGVGILRTIEALTPLAQIDPTVLDIFDPEATARALADINGVPAKVLRSPEELAAVKQQKTQAANTQALIQGLPAVTGGIKDIAGAAAAAGNIPPNQPGVGQ